MMSGWRLAQASSPQHDPRIAELLLFSIALALFVVPLVHLLKLQAKSSAALIALSVLGSQLLACVYLAADVLVYFARRQ